MMRVVCLATITTFITACSLLSPVQTEQPKSYLLNKVPAHVGKASHRSKTILVTQPTTSPVFDTTQMAYTSKQYGVSYFVHNQWAETPSQMLLPLMVQTLSNMHAYRAVIAPPFGAHTDYVLNTQINQLMQNFTHYPAVLQFSMRAEIVSMVTNKVVASKQFVVSLPIDRQTPYDGVVVANDAVAVVLRQLAEFCRAHT